MSRGDRVGGQGGWEQRSDACVKIQNIIWGMGVGLWGGGGVGLGSQGGCEWRSEAFVKIQKNFFFFWGGGADQVRGEVGPGWMGTEN